MLNIEKATKIAEEVVEAVQKPVTVKIRKGWDNNHIVYEELAKNLEDIRNSRNNLAWED